MAQSVVIGLQLTMLVEKKNQMSPPDSTSNMHNLLYPISFKLVKDIGQADIHFILSGHNISTKLHIFAQSGPLNKN